jgi:uncharacterized protein involved in exopolysaccharide biosynthesis
MNTDPNPSVTPRDLLRALRERRRLWMAPTILCTGIGVLCAVIMPRKWEASQALVVRQEAAGGDQARPGSFSSLDEMKRTQETILEIAKSRTVLAETLAEVGPPPSLLQWGQFPSEQDVEDLRRNIRMTPPGGAEFGLTEVVYLAVRSEDRDRSLTLLTALCKHLEEQFMQVRDERAQSVLDELQKTVDLAEKDLQDATSQLATFESAVGADLTELRMLLESTSGTSDLRQKLVALQNTRQEYSAQMQQQKQLLAMLEVAEDDPQALVATPNSLLDAQPALRRLKEGLIEAQLLTSRLLGRRSERHPEVVAAQFAEEEVRASLRRELDTAIRGVEVDLKVSADRLAAVEAEISLGTTRLERLASLRARYANLVALTTDRTQLLEVARRNFAEAHASQASARAASLIGRIDAPHVGVNPVGPGRTVVAATGLAGGLAIGIALVFLFGLPAPAEWASRAERGPDQTAQNPERDRTERRQSDVPRPPARERKPPVPAMQTSSVTTQEFGMFPGRTLREAVEEVRQRDAHESAKS